ncbi:hypothetical protein MMC07_001301 [Pseudocyphellaria aurata]|nr:hypothetical protein [Pseudocyphellaria aurata]
MDSFTILVSTITTLDVTIKVFKKVVSLVADGKNLSNELIAVSNDVTDFRLVLTAIEEAAVEERRLMASLNLGLDPGARTLAIEDITPAATIAAPNMIQRAHDKLLEISECVQKLLDIRDAKGWATVNESERLQRHQGDILAELLRQFHLANKNSGQERRLLENFAARGIEQAASSSNTGEPAFPVALITSGSSSDSPLEGRNYYDSYAINNGKASVCKFLLENGADPLMEDGENQQGDVIAVNLLLEHNADPNITTPSGMAPLHFVVEALTPTCIAPLLAHGADPLAVDHNRHTTLSFAVSCHDDEAYLLPIIQAGADLEAKTNYECTPLINAVSKDRVRAVKCLLDTGADINGIGQYGQSPVQYAVEFNSHACLRLLLDRGADCMVRCEEKGPTIIQIAVRHGDLKTVTMLLDAPMGFFADEDLEAESPDGFTIEECVQKRTNEEQIIGFPEAVLALIQKVTTPNEIGGHDAVSLVDGPVDEDVEDETEVEEDAVENLIT